MAHSRTDISFSDNYRGLQIGQSFGPINLPPGGQPITYYKKVSTNGEPPERPETPPEPSSNVPFRRDPQFVERPALREQIRTKLSEPAGRVALVGLGGVGKSQLAIEHARRLRAESPQTWVLWIHASNTARFDQSVRDITDELKIYGRKNPKADHLHLLLGWLRNKSKGRWLVVLDNADDARFLLDPPPVSYGVQQVRRRMDYFPAVDHGSMIITSRSKSEALKLVYETDVISILPMSEDEAEALLAGKLGQPSPHDLHLVRGLDCMPLAITQAAAYIRERGQLCSVQQYREQIERSRTSRANLLLRNMPILGRDAESNNSVFLTWRISFQHIDHTRRSAAELLSLMSFCDRLAIPDTLLRANEDEDKGSDSSFEEDIVMLRNFSFVSETVDMRTWEMHKLVQDATQIWLEDCGRLDGARDRFIHRLDEVFPSGRYENWALCRMLFPHVKRAIGQRPRTGEALSDWASIMYNAAWFAHEQGDHAGAAAMAVSSMTFRVQQLGEDSELTLRSAAMVGLTYRNQGWWEEAEQLFVKIMKTRRTKLGPDHPDTLNSMVNLASTYRSQGRWQEAEQLFVEVVETSRAKLGQHHPDTLTSMANLASTYRNQGRWQEAEQLFKKVTETRRAKLGPDHPSVLTSMANLASTHRYQGRWQEAEQLEVNVVETSRTKLGPDHPSTLTAMSNLASTYYGQGRWEEAEQLEVKVVETSSSKLGPDHPDTLTSIANLASTYWNQGRWQEAEQLFVKVMETRRAKLGPDHPDTLIGIANLASAYCDQGRWAEAEQLEVKVVETLRAKLGPDHPDTLTSMANLAWTYSGQGRWEEAEQLEVKVMETRRAKLGPDHPDTLISMANLASTWRDLCRWEEAEQLSVKVMETRRAKVGSDHKAR